MEAGGFGPWRAAPARQVRAEAAPARGRCCNRDADEDSESGGEDAGVQSPAAPRLPGRPQRPTVATAAARSPRTPASWRPPERRSRPATANRTPATAVGPTVEAGAAEAAAIMKMQARARRTWTADRDIWTPAKRPRQTPAESTACPAGGQLGPTAALNGGGACPPRGCQGAGRGRSGARHTGSSRPGRRASVVPAPSVVGGGRNGDTGGGSGRGDGCGDEDTESGGEARDARAPAAALGSRTDARHLVPTAIYVGSGGDGDADGGSSGGGGSDYEDAGPGTGKENVDGGPGYMDASEETEADASRVDCVPRLPRRQSTRPVAAGGPVLKTPVWMWMSMLLQC